MKFFDECIHNLGDTHAIDEYQKYYRAYQNFEKFILLGNGGSNSAAGHIAQDMTKRGDKKALAFTDASMLTCLMNDFGVEHAYAKFIEYYADPDTFVILISSSGQSANIIEAVRWCQAETIAYGVLTGFDEHNSVRTMSTDAVFNYYIPTMSYGVAECLHQIFLHGVVECQ
jgi:D-sedoheptulose 7-phosphate isomerase